MFPSAYGHNLEEDVCHDTSGHFQRLLVILLQVRLTSPLLCSALSAPTNALFNICPIIFLCPQASRQTGLQQELIESDAQVCLLCRSWSADRISMEGFVRM